MSALRKLLAEATPGPWQWYISDYDKGTVFLTPNVDEDMVIGDGIIEPDARLLVYLRNHAEDFAALIEAAQNMVGPNGYPVAQAYHELLAALAPFEGEK